MPVVPTRQILDRAFAERYGVAAFQQPGSRRPAILMDQPAEHVPPFDRRLSRPPGLRCPVTGGHGQAQSPMWSLRHVVRDVRLKYSLEVPTPVD